VQTVSTGSATIKAFKRNGLMKTNPKDAPRAAPPGTVALA
jgi:hypothetical protein